MCLRVCAASEEVEVVFGEERPREVVVSTAVCLTLRRHKHGSIYSPHKYSLYFKIKSEKVRHDLHKHGEKSEFLTATVERK